MNKNTQMRNYFVFLIIILYWLCYFVFDMMVNVFQSYAYQHHLSAKLYPLMSAASLRISFVVFFLCLLEKMQPIKQQRWLLISVLLLLIIALLMPFKLAIYPFMVGMIKDLQNLLELWLQLYVPPRFRATIEGITVGLAGFSDLFSVILENNWGLHPQRYHYLALVFFISMSFFWYFSGKTKLHKSNTPKQPSASLSILLTQHTYILIAFFLAGFNASIFNYTYFLATEVLPNFSAQNYQYAIYSGCIIGPIFIGPIADKKGIFSITILTGCLLILIILLDAFLFHFSWLPLLHYALAFFKSGLAESAAALSMALIGERLLDQGIFRAFSISNIFFGMGSIFAGRIYEFFSNSFFLTQLIMAFVSSMLIVLLCGFYKKNTRIRPTPT